MSLRVLVAEKLDKVQKSLMAGTNKRVVSETFDRPRVVVELVPGLGRCSERPAGLVLSCCCTIILIL